MDDKVYSVIAGLHRTLNEIISLDMDSRTKQYWCLSRVCYGIASEIDSIVDDFAYTGDLESLKRVASLGVDLRKSFLCATRRGHLEIVKYLVEKDEEYKLNGVVVRSAFHDVVYRSYLEMEKNRSELCLNKNEGLIGAIMNEHLEVVKYLISIGVEFRFNGNSVDYAIKAAVKSGNLPIIKYLISVGSNYYGFGLNQLLGLNRLPSTREQLLLAIDIASVNKE